MPNLVNAFKVFRCFFPEKIPKSIYTFEKHPLAGLDISYITLKPTSCAIYPFKNSKCHYHENEQ